MTLGSSYYGLTFSETERPADQVVIEAGPSVFSVEPVELGMSSVSAGEAILVATRSQFEVTPNQLSMSSSGIDEHMIAASASIFSMEATPLAMSSSGISEHVVAASATRFSMSAVELSMSSSGIDNHELPATSSQFKMQPVELSMSSQTIDVHELTASLTRFAISPDKLSFSSTNVDAHELAATPSRFEFSPAKLTFSSATAGEHVLPQLASLFSVLPVSLTMSSSGTGEHQIPASPSRFSMLAEKLSMSSSGTGEHILPQSPSFFSMLPFKLSMSSSGVDEHILNASASLFSVGPALLSMSSSGIDNHELVATPSRFEMVPVELSFQSSPVTGEAACFQGAGYMYSDDMPGGYNLTPDSGYVSLYFRYQGGNPDELFTWRNTLFQSHRADESHLEFRLEAAADGAWPDLVIEANDDTGTHTFLTDLESDGGPNLYDGNWHHLMFGNDFGGVGWYFFVDGVRYQGRTGSNQGVWFKHVQANTAAGNFEEVDLVATRVQAPGGTQNLYGCLDEVIVVNDRLWVHVDTHDVDYLYNDGYGRLIEDIEANNPTGLWSAVFNAWRLRQDQNEVFGFEYRDPDATERYSLTTFGYVIITEGIPGAAP